jgi:hypothetical protein
MNTIGKAPVWYASPSDVKTYGRWELLKIIQDNGWGEITGIHKVDDLPVEQLRDIINSKMDEQNQEVK